MHSSHSSDQMLPDMVLLLTRDEYDVIEFFLEYHSWIFGPSNIVVVDNGSTNTHVLAVYEKYMKLGVTVFSETRPFFQATAFMSEYAAIYKDKCRFLFPLETDEFITFHDRPMEVFDVIAFKAYLNDLPLDVGAVQYSKVLCSIFEERHKGEPVLNIDRFYDQKWDKFFVRGATCMGIKQWSHSCFSTGTDMRSSTLSLLHFHDTGGKRAFERSRNIIQCILPNDLDILQTIKYLHQIAYGPVLNGHRIQQYLSFLLRQYCYEQFKVHVGRRPTESEMAIVSADVTGDTVDKVKCNLKENVWMDERGEEKEKGTVLHGIDLETYMFQETGKENNRKQALNASEQPIYIFTINSMSLWLSHRVKK
jgi:hypothetical protein